MPVVAFKQLIFKCLVLNLLSIELLDNSVELQYWLFNIVHETWK